MHDHPASVDRRLSLGLAGLIGCGSGPEGPKLVPVTGTVKLDGKPVTRARVRFIPTDDTKGLGSEAVTDEEGKYALTGTRGGTGAAAGTYKVVISKRLMPNGSDVPADDNTPPIESPARESLPPKFSDFSMTTLTAKVPEAGGTVDFDLKRQ